jgi:hypothetical protein
MRQRAARHDVLGPDGVRVRIEIDEVARPHIDRANAEAERAGIEPIKINQSLKGEL